MLVISSELNDKIDFLYGNTHDLFCELKRLETFSEEVIDALNLLSTCIMKDFTARAYPDLVTFAFWIRKSNIEELKNRVKPFENRFGRGLCFHIAPSNVPLNFAYSIVAGLLAGNSNIVRISSKKFPQAEILIDILNQKKIEIINNYVSILKYDRNRQINDYFSSICDTRIVWGGDGTVRELRNSPMKIRSKEIVFADRFSMLLINADHYLKFDDKKRIANDFYNDTYLFDQNACTAPKIVLWEGNNIEDAQKIFWSQLKIKVINDYKSYPVKAVEKLTKSLVISSIIPDSKIISMTNWLVRLEIPSIDERIQEYFGDSGLFIEYKIQEDYIEFMSLLNEKMQTLSYFGVNKDKLLNFIREKKTPGIDRIVPIGKTADFDLNWDGYDLIHELSREILDFE